MGKEAKEGAETALTQEGCKRRQGTVKAKHSKPGTLGSTGSRQRLLEVSQNSCLETTGDSGPWTLCGRSRSAVRVRALSSALQTCVLCVPLGDRASGALSRQKLFPSTPGSGPGGQAFWPCCC